MADHNKLAGKLTFTEEVLAQIADMHCDADPLYKGSIDELMKEGAPA
jgi:hypothetical protein